MKFYADKFRRIRQLKRIPVLQVTKILDISRGSLWVWEKGQRIPSEANIRALAKAINIEVSEISDLRSIKNTMVKDFAEPVKALLEIADSNIKERAQTTQVLKLQIDLLENRLSNASIIINALISSLNTAFYIKSTDQKLIIANSAFLTMLKLNINTDIIGKEDKDIFPLKEATLNTEQDAEVINTGKSISGLENYIPGTRKQLSGLISKIPILDPNNKIIGLIGVFTDTNELIKTKKKLIEKSHELNITKERLDLALKGSNVGLWDWNAETGHVIYDKTYSNMLGYKQKELKPNIDTWLNMIHPDDIDKTRKEIDKHFTNQDVVYTAEFRMKSKNDDWKWILSRGKVFRRDSNGKPTRMIGTHNDITERKKNEEKAIESAERLDLAMKGAKAGSWDWNLITGEDIFDSRWCGILGYRKGELEPVGSTWENLIHPDDKEQVMDVVNKHLVDQNIEYDLEYRMKCKNGEWKWILAVGRVSKRDLKGKPIRMTGVIYDINDRKIAEHKLLNNETKFSKTMSNSPAIVYQFTISSEGIFTFPYVSDKSLNIIGIPAEDIMHDSSKFFNNIHPEDQEIFSESIMRAAETFEVFPLTFRFMKTGKIIWLEACGTPTKLENGDKHWDGFLFDITKRKNTEKLLLESEEK